MPELSYAAGLTDNIRNNHSMMKDLSGVTKMSPDQRRDIIRRFIEEVEKNDITRELLSEWGLRLSNDIIHFTARRLEPETIHFGNGTWYKSSERPSEWSSAAVKNPVLRTVSILNNNYLRIEKFINNLNTITSYCILYFSLI